jgi:hypothetical protein
MAEFPDSLVNHLVNGYSQSVHSAMILPLIVNSSTARSVQIELIRTYGGPVVKIGRPIVLNGIACSWSIHH